MKFKKKKKKKKSPPLIHVDIGLLADDVCETPPNTFNGGQSKHNLLLPVDIRVQNTKNMLEVLVRYQRLKIKTPKKKKQIRSKFC